MPLLGSSTAAHDSIIITPLLLDHLRWLHVPERVHYKLCLLVYCKGTQSSCTTTAIDRSPAQYVERRSPSSTARWSFVPDRLLHSYLRRCVTASSAFCQSSSTTRPSTQSLHVWSSGFFCRGSGCLELREPLLTANSFRQLLKTRLFAEY